MRVYTKNVSWSIRWEVYMSKKATYAPYGYNANRDARWYVEESEGVSCDEIAARFNARHHRSRLVTGGYVSRIVRDVHLYYCVFDRPACRMLKGLATDPYAVWQAEVEMRHGHHSLARLCSLLKNKRRFQWIGPAVRRRIMALEKLG